MSTKLTQKGTAMVDSQALQLVLAAAQVNESISQHLSKSLINKGYKFASPATLSFLSTLECGFNYGSEIARNLKVSRQMVAKTVKGLCLAGYLEQVDDIGKQKKIIFTENGERLMSDSRQLLADIDKTLTKQLSQVTITSTVTSLNKIQMLMAQLEDR
jgi:DNA-binding MarR family transcriptional regulator